VKSLTGIQFSSQYILLLLFLPLSGTELHAFRPPCCFHQLTKGDIWVMFIIDKVWCISLTIPLPQTLRILARLQSVPYDSVLQNNLRTTHTAVCRVLLLYCVAGTRYRLQWA